MYRLVPKGAHPNCIERHYDAKGGRGSRAMTLKVATATDCEGENGI